MRLKTQQTTHQGAGFASKTRILFFSCLFTNVSEPDLQKGFCISTDEAKEEGKLHHITVKGFQFCLLLQFHTTFTLHLQ